MRVAPKAGARPNRMPVRSATPNANASDETVEEMSTLQPFPDGSIEETRATTLHEMIGKVGGATDQMVEWVHLDKIERCRWRRRGPSENFVPDDFVAVIP
jgi:hypothetical protein